ncbi:hypothetical protein TBLA_0G01450 [Henningerozyma blattae CBS 6284]|uniref:Peroxin/Ferlin domain-containing protein n=1 Tax=Henningerozyma blattae (strain ATCC 34711 / CBS 6284 / DSM 70876 / NBRC 10599 / NRRL Y-10934 / UCD 77-7) TaxID=1071380 RepID=I2H6T9_HENB6|nr:hypothetical protein TBLA_0G01450 [Tetrapisispora blattae CBS 6284]CCH62091.1 hypothetical protein TBLA_0G01450 [Tetrapisispora blattae CBS 6284]
MQGSIIGNLIAVRSLTNSYPFFQIINEIFNLLTWNNDIKYNLISLFTYSLVVLWFQDIFRYLGHGILLVIIYFWYRFEQNKKRFNEITKDDNIRIINEISDKFDILIEPIMQYDTDKIKQISVISLVVLPICSLIINIRRIILIIGLFLLSFNAPMMIRLRKHLLDTNNLIEDIVMAKRKKLKADIKNDTKQKEFELLIEKKKSNLLNTPKFAYILYENQRKWIGLGWTDNMLTYERSNWTDEFLNSSESIETFQLPIEDKSENSGDTDGKQINEVHNYQWKWVDPCWKLDLTNDGIIEDCPIKTVNDPGDNDGFIYYDNAWNKPSVEDSYSKYTRRRRWVRTAELTNEVE